jgi:hypothetical protein
MISLHNGGKDRLSARLAILTLFKIGFFVYGNQNYDSIGPQKYFFRIYDHSYKVAGSSVKVASNLPAHFSTAVKTVEKKTTNIWSSQSLYL